MTTKKAEVVDSTELIVIDDQQLPTGVIRKGFFLIAVNGPDDMSIKFDTSMLPERVQELIRQAGPTKQDAEDVVIDSAEMYEYAATLRRQARDGKKELDDARIEITGRIDRFWEAVMLEFRGDKSLKDGAVPTYDEAMHLLDDKLNAYLAAEEKKRKEEQRLENERIERERKEKEAEQKRIEDEARAEQERLRLEAEAASESGDDEKLAEIVEQAREIADEAQERSDALADEVAMLHPTAIATGPPPRVAGFTPTKKWVCIIDSPIEFFRGIHDGKIPKAYGIGWEPGKDAQKGLDAQASLLKNDFDYPGCHAEEKKGGSSR